MFVAVCNFRQSILNSGCTPPVLAFFRSQIPDGRNLRSSTTQAKCVGTVVTITGAIIITLYQGPQILSSPFKSDISNNLVTQPSNWVLGGIFLAITAVFASMYFISQAFGLKKYPPVTIVIFAYCSICAILAVLTSLIAEVDMSSYSLKPKKRLFSVLYSGSFDIAFQVTFQAWCIGRKGPFFVAMFHPVGIVFSTLKMVSILEVCWDQLLL